MFELRVCLTCRDASSISKPESQSLQVPSSNYAQGVKKEGLNGGQVRPLATLIPGGCCHPFSDKQKVMSRFCALESIFDE